MYDLLLDFTRRPAPFSRYTAKELWTRPHLAQQMLEYHLNQETDLASRRLNSIDQIVGWIDNKINLTGKRVCDLGCGPGLYTQRYVDKGAQVTGIDFSRNSLEYARNQCNGTVEYIEADYLTDDLPSGFDLITLIYTDYCVLSQEQRKTLLDRIHIMLNPTGKLIMDFATTAALTDRTETLQIEERLMGGFWAPGDYVGMLKSFIYPDKNLALDRYMIVEPKETWEIFNWFQYYAVEDITNELNHSGFEIIEMKDEFSEADLTQQTSLIGTIASPIRL